MEIFSLAVALFGKFNIPGILFGESRSFETVVSKIQEV